MWNDLPPPPPAAVYMQVAQLEESAASSSVDAAVSSLAASSVSSSIAAKGDLKTTIKLPAASSAAALVVPRLGRCLAVNGPVEINPTLDANEYFGRYVRGAGVVAFTQKADGSADMTIEVDISQAPSHGSVVPKTIKALDASKYVYKYEPNPYYEGEDTAVVTLTAGDKKIEIMYQFSVATGPTEIPVKGLDGLEVGKTVDPARCPKVYWKLAGLDKHVFAMDF